MAVITDIGQRLGVDLSGVVPHFYSDGATDATVFNLADKYLVKITDLNTIRTQAEFLQENPNGVFQSLLCSNEELGYECFEFIDGIHYDGELIDLVRPDDVVGGGQVGVFRRGDEVGKRGHKAFDRDGHFHTADAIIAAGDNTTLFLGTDNKLL